MKEGPQIDHARYEAARRREMRLKSPRIALESIANYHVEMAQHAITLRHLLEQTRYYPEFCTPQIKEVIAYLEGQMEKHHLSAFGEHPNWAVTRKQIEELI